jgi:ABC-type nitrate/sulfonate/bicarbonate transport system ATPase subunit
MRKLHVDKYRNKRPRELSGGMKTRVALGRALLLRPEFLFLDEPMASLDIGLRWDMYKTLVEERRKSECATVLSTHDILEALVVGDYVCVMGFKGGRTLLKHVSNGVPEVNLASMGMKEVLERIAGQVDDVAEAIIALSDGATGCGS